MQFVSMRQWTQLESIKKYTQSEELHINLKRNLKFSYI